MDYFNQFKTPDEFVNGFKDTADAWNRLTLFMKSRNVSVDKLSEYDKSEVRKRIKTWMARQIWRMQGYYEVNNRYDRAVQTALDEVKKS
jgi:carboxyl-terminal processing protease